MNYITQEHFDRLRAGKVREGDVLFCLRGSLGKIALVRNIGIAAIASSLIIVRPTVAILPKFLLVYLGSPQAEAEVQRYDNGSAQPNLAGADLARFRIPLPPLAEQTRIVAEVERRLSVVEELEAVVTTNLQRAARLRQSVLQQAFSGNL